MPINHSDDLSCLHGLNPISYNQIKGFSVLVVVAQLDQCVEDLANQRFVKTTYELLKVNIPDASKAKKKLKTHNQVRKKL